MLRLFLPEFQLLILYSNAPFRFQRIFMKLSKYFIANWHALFPSEFQNYTPYVSGEI